MVREDIISTRTIGDEKELNNIFRIENESIVSNENSNNCSYDKNGIESPNDYEIREIVLEGLIDIETWNKIKRFEIDNPDKIRKWREEDEEKRFHDRDNSYLVNRRVNKRNEICNHIDNKIKKENTRTISNIKKSSRIEELIKDCMEYEPKNSFVLSVKSQFEFKGYLSEKQIAILERILDKAMLYENS